MCDNRYNGWHNWETWVTNLWFDDFFSEDAANTYAISEDASEATMILESLIEDTIRKSVESDNESGLQSDFIGMCIQAVDFREIADHYIDDVIREDIMTTDTRSLVGDILKKTKGSTLYEG